MKINQLFLAFIIGLISVSCQPEDKRKLKLSPLFSDHMVLQQKQDIAFWGEYSPMKKITVNGSWGDEASIESDENGDWKMTLKSPAAGGPYSIKVISADSTIVIDDILFGEVWLASGQSNMEMPLKGWPPNDPINNSSEEISNATHPNIRMFTVTRNLAVKSLNSIQGQWLVASPETAKDFSASAYFFAKRLQEELNVPIGIIHSSWGGTPAEAWTSASALRNLGDFNQQLDAMERPESLEETKNWFDQWPSKKFPVTEAEWRAVNFNDLDAIDPEFDDSNWETKPIPGRIDQLNDGYLDGVIWLRKEFEIQDIASEYILEIGAVDDMDATYINGEKVGGLAGSGYYDTNREMKIPGSLLKKGKNTIAIRVIDTGGPGSVDGPVQLINEDGNSISLEGEWRSMIKAEIYSGLFYEYDFDTDLVNKPNFVELNSHLPSVLFNAMINPLLPYTIKGAIWYQGEANVSRDKQYKKLFPAMIKDWRNRWVDDFPFYFVQIAPFIYEPNPELQISQKLREAQRYALKTPNTGMVVTLDIGNPTNIHPANKQDVGYRLAGLALANDYGKDIVASGPLFKGLKKVKNTLLVDFEDVGSGLICHEKVLKGFEIAGADKVFVPAKAEIKNEIVEVSNNTVKDPEYVRYAWRDDSVATLFNIEGLPASSFSSE